jgi:hypothetical protein
MHGGEDLAPCAYVHESYVGSPAWQLIALILVVLNSYLDFCHKVFVPEDHKTLDDMRCSFLMYFVHKAKMRTLTVKKQRTD